RNYNRSQRRKRVCILQNPNLKCIKTFWLKLSENERSKILQIDLNKLCKQMEKQRSSFFKLFKGIKNIQYLQILLECIKNLSKMDDQIFGDFLQVDKYPQITVKDEYRSLKILNIMKICNEMYPEDN